jgi:hypothetical protein
MIEVILNDRLGKKIRVKCNSDDTVHDLKVRAVVPHVFCMPALLVALLSLCLCLCCVARS